ncbi:MAG TPA: hypothetical protein VJZ32_01485 [Candidatus Bathyarchaeia archaeon]|nr:hypothetical protein [Candidatus Bathyarchaeia archaeon]
MPDLSNITEAHESLRNLTQDQVTKLLLANSQLTLTQLETLLADSIATGEEVKRTRKRFYRPIGAKITRGSYNRTLIQAQNNVIRSIYTVLLLGYLRLFDTASLQPFVELADTIESYVQETKVSKSNHDSTRHLEDRLREFISALAKRHSFKDTL